MERNDLLPISPVLPDGTLDDRMVSRRIVLYEGRNGKKVERFEVQTPKGMRSFIFKPLTNDDTLGREAWVYQHLLPRIPIHYPQMLACAEHDNPDTYWTIYEDLGSLDHRFDFPVLKLAAEAIPYWHRLPTEFVPSRYKGHTPYIDDVLAMLSAQRMCLLSVLNELPVPRHSIHQFERLLTELAGGFPAERAVSHGDYYPGNMAYIDGRLIVLDWEYVHVNSVYWDLYNLIDITSPKYRKSALEPSQRRELLLAYADARTSLGSTCSSPCSSPSPVTLLRNYCMYAAMYSAWVLSLIDQDLKAGRFDPVLLNAQRLETYRVFSDCLAEV